MKNYIQNKNNLKKGNFISVSSINIVVKDEIEFDLKLPDLESTLRDLPSSFLKNVDYIMFGNFDFLRKKGYNASYMDGIIYVLNSQEKNYDVLDDIVHEIGHSVEEWQSEIIYGDGALEKEFLQKRKTLNAEFKKEGIEIPEKIMRETEYNQSLDLFFSDEIGYPRMSTISQGIFYSPYGATSLREYFANGFEAYYYHKDLYLKNVSPILFSKLEDLELGEMQ